MFFQKISRSLFVLVAGLLAGNAFAVQSFHHTLAPVERARMAQNRAVRPSQAAATTTRTASASTRASAVKVQAAPPVNVLNHRFLGWNHRAADPAAYAQRFSRAHAAAKTAPVATKGIVALTAPAILRSSVRALVSGAAAPSSIPGLLTRPSTLAGFLPTSVAAGDLNGDGYTDWVVANGGDDTLWVYLGHGDGTADAPFILPLNFAGPIAVAIVDLRLSGQNDIVVAEADGWAIGVFLNNGDGTFAPESNYDLPDSPGAMVVADFNFDGRPDVAVGFDGNNGVPLALLVNDGVGGFLPANPSQWQLHGVADPSPAIDWMAAADVDGDGMIDLVVAEHNALNAVAVFTNSPDPDPNHAVNRVFTLSPNFITIDQNSFGFHNLAVALGDVNEDGCVDAVVTDSVGTATVYPGSCDGTFAGVPTSFSTGDVSQSLALADLTGSGHLDIVTGGLYTGAIAFGDSAGNLLSVLRGDGSGNFSQARVFRGHPSMVSLAIADLNGDGKLDVVSANQGDDSVSAFVNDGSAGFGDPQGWSIGYTDGTVNSPVSGVLFADVNGDGAKDMVVLQRPDAPGGDFQVSVMLANGPGSYGAPVRSAVFPDSLYLNGDFALADFRGTGKADFVAIGVDASFALGQPFLAFAPSNGDGTFGTPNIVNSPNANGIFAVGDFNKDGKLDLAVLGHASGSAQPSLTVFLGNGDGTFRELAPVVFGNTQPRFPSSIYAADLHKSGKLDLLVHLDNDQSVSELYELAGNGDGTFRAPILLYTNFDAFTVADVNGDGSPDLVTCKDPGASAAAFTVPQVNIFLSQGNGLFAAGASYAPYNNNGADFPTWRGSANGAQGDCIVADFDGDGKLDIAVTQRAQSGDERAFVQFLSGNGDGTFTPNYNTYSFGKGNAPQFAFDASGDGRADFVEIDAATASLHFIPGTVGPAMQMSFSSMPIIGTGHGVVTLNSPAASDTIVSLSASDANVFVLPTLTIPAGSTSADFLFGLGQGFDNSKTFTVTAQANGASVSAAGYAAASAPNSQFGLNISAASVALTAAPGGRSLTDDLITVNSVDGYATTATLSCKGLPAGITCQFSPAMAVIKAQGKGLANLVVNVDASVAPTDYPFEIIVSDGAVTASVPASITVSTDVQLANIVSTVHADRDDVSPNEKFTCVATVTNNGNAPATNVHVALDFQGATSIVGLRGTAGSCTTTADGQMYCDIPTLAPGASATMNADMKAGDIGAVLFTVATTGQNVAPSQPVSSANYVLSVSDFELATDTPHSAIVAGQTASYPLTVASLFANFDRAVTLTCSGLPALASCNFSQNNFVPKSGASVDLSISTKAATKAQNSAPDAPVYAWLSFASLLALGARATRKRSLIALVLLVALMLALTGCAGFFTSESGNSPSNNNGGGTPTTTPQPGTPAGSYTVTVTASAGAVQHTTSVTLSVQ